MSPDSEDDLTGEIAEKLAEHGIIANSNAIRKLSRADPPESLIEDLSSNFSDVLVITEDHVQQCIDAHTSPSNTQSTEDLSVPDSSVSDSEASKKNKSSSTEQASKSTSQSTTVLQESQDSSDSTRVKNKPSEPTHPTRSENDTPTSSAEQTRSTQHRSVTVTKNVTGASRCTGEYSDFVGYFRDRYEKISSILRDRVSPRTIDSVKQRGTQSQITIVGMVNNIRSTSSSNRLLELEDPTGTISVLLSDQRLIEEAGNLDVNPTPPIGR
ncbi:MAG: hypothetical protein SV377_04555 [Halobacteria archaeon]|nr:hypothetical protein [Halobacteria archaeon]